MSDDWAAAARRLAGMAGVVLGWSPDAFWRATPAELATVVHALTGGEAAARPPDAATRNDCRRRFPMPMDDEIDRLVVGVRAEP